FYLDNKKDYYLKYYEKISSEVTAYENKLEKPAFEKIGGSATARLDIRGTINKPKLELQGEIKNPLYGRYLFDSVSVKAQYSEGSLSIKDLSLNNEGARAAFWGYADLEGRLDLKAQARNYSLDFLKIFIDKPFNGWLNLDGGIGGTFTAPTLSISFEGSRGDIGGIGFDKLSGKIFYDGETGYFKDMKLVEGKDISKGDAYFDLKGNGWAKATIEGEAIGFAGLMTNEIEWQSAKSHGEISLLMDNWKPKLYGYLYVTDALFFVKRLNAYMMTGYLDLVADGNDIKVKQLSGSWYNGSQPNSLSVSGAVELNSLNMNWLIADSHFSVDMPNIYKGEMDLRGVSLSGRPSNMLLKGRLDFNDGAMVLPKTGIGAVGTQPAADSPKLKLNLLINLKKNVYLSAGDILTLDLSNIFLNLEMAGSDLKVTGDMSDPKLLGKIVFGRGTVNILSREFNLLSEDNQKKYYPYDLDRISENYAQFLGDGVMPYLRLSALVKVEKQDDKDPAKRKEISIVSNIIGQLQAKEESKKLNIAFNAFQEDKTKTPPELVPIASSDQDIRFMLLPDFIKSLAGNESGPASAPNALVADYLNSRLQSVVFRGVERGIERALGLENLTLEYNFGSDIKRAMGVGGDSRTGQNAGFGVGLTKGFFDKLYIDVRYSQGMEQQAGVQQSTYLNYQITYKLSSIWSIAYYREPASFYDLNSGIYKTTLKLGFSF
ncbi:MAG: translocation/assembly module TamB domain-containing protein, partial [Candidatus Margulisiibacteriota bacterium]